jgi:NitT/TauT family transport system substrate-binding protein
MSRLRNKRNARILRGISLISMSFWAAPRLIFLKAAFSIYSIANEFGCIACARKPASSSPATEGQTMKFRARLTAALLATLATAGVSIAQAAEINFITDFGFNGRHAYFYVAREKGYYKAEGFDVNFVRGQGSADAIKKVAAGVATFGFADAGSLVLARGNDGVPVKLVSVVYAKPPQAIFAIKGSGINSPKDLEGKTVADTASSSVRLLFPAFAKAAGIDASKVKWVVAEGSALPSLLANGRADAICQFSVGEPLIAAAVAPKEVIRINYADSNLDYYGNGLIASEEMIAKSPDQVKAFVRATIKGMKDAFANPAEAATIMAKYQKELQPAVIEGETRLVKELAEVKGSLGHIDPKSIASTVDVMSANFTLKNPVKPEDLFAPGFID